MTGARTVRFVVPVGIDDPARVSGGNVYDRHLRGGLRRLGWDVKMTEVADRAGVAAALAVEPGALVLVDGLVAGWAPEALEAAADRARIVVLAHMVAAAFPGASAQAADAERRALASAVRVIVTSGWTATEFVRLGLVEPDRVAVAVPGAHDGAVVMGPVGHRDLLCVGAIVPHKGQDLLLNALAMLPDPDWTCTIAGSTTAHPDFTARIAEASAGLDGRVRMTGVLDGAGLDRAYRRCGVLVAPSRVESFGMAIADARRRGIPVIATAVGGVPETVAGGGALLVERDDPDALADALLRWLTDPPLRARLRLEALKARAHAPRWADTVAHVDRILEAA